MPIIVRQEEDGIISHSLEADRRILGIPLYEIQTKFSSDDFWEKAIEGSWKLREVHFRPEYASSYYARRNIAWLVRFFFWVEEDVYWHWLMGKLLWKWLKLIKAPEIGEEFTWRKHFKPIAMVCRK